MNDKQMLNVKLTELFLSKAKTPTDAIIILWIKELSARFQIDVIVQAIERMKWSPDDFPSLGKIADEIDEVIAINVKKIIMSGDETAVKIAKKSGINLEYIREDIPTLIKRLPTFVRAYKEMMETNIKISNDCKSIE